MPDKSGYINYFEILGVDENAKAGEIRKQYRLRIQALVAEIRKSQITEAKRAQFLLEMAKLNAAVLVLRDKDKKEQYLTERQELMDIEQDYIAAEEEGPAVLEKIRARYESRMRSFMTRYAEEMMLAAGQDKDCVEASGWDAAHERHASRILRQYRHRLQHQIMERLPYTEITRPEIDWDDRRSFVQSVVNGS